MERHLALHPQQRAQVAIHLQMQRAVRTAAHGVGIRVGARTRGVEVNHLRSRISVNCEVVDLVDLHFKAGRRQRQRGYAHHIHAGANQRQGQPAHTIEALADCIDLSTLGREQPQGQVGIAEREAHRVRVE